MVTGLLGSAALPRMAAGAAPIDVLTVRGHTLSYDGTAVRCAIGAGGISVRKREGDGATPAGIFPLRAAFYRADRVAAPSTLLPCRALQPQDGWCDDPAQPGYNTLVTLGAPGHHEEMWRSDHLYDVVVTLGYNDSPAVPGLGSAIFLHVASPRLTPTVGCVAVPYAALLPILARCTPQTRIDIAAG